MGKLKFSSAATNDDIRTRVHVARRALDSKSGDVAQRPCLLAHALWQLAAEVVVNDPTRQMVNRPGFAGGLGL